MTTLNFALSRTAGRELRGRATRSCARGSTTTRNVSPWLELAHDLDLDRPLRRHQRGHDARPRRPRAAAQRADAGGRVPGRVERGRHAHRRPPDRRARARGGRARLGGRRPLRAARPDRRRRVRRRRAASARRTSSSGRTSGVAYGRARAARGWRPYKVRPAPTSRSGKRFETGTLPYELLAGFVAAVEYIESLGWEGIVAWERALGERFLAGLPPSDHGSTGCPTMDGRVPTFAFSVDGISAEEAAARLGERGFAVWRGNYYALEVMKRLGLEDDGGAVRVGFVHYNTRRRGRPAPRGARPAGVTRRREWAALVALVLLSTAFRAWAAVEVPVPWIAPDEMVYGMLGRSLWLHGSLAILGGPTPYYSLLTPLLAGFPLAAFGLGTGYDLLQGLQALVMSLAAVPVFLWARTLVPRWSALTAAALTLATPVLAYSGLVMTEVLFYPLLVTRRLGGRGGDRAPDAGQPDPAPGRVRRRLRDPHPGDRARAGARQQRRCSTPFSPARGGACRRQLPAAVGFAVLSAGWAVWRLATGKGALGGYDVVASTSYSVGGRRPLRPLPRRLAADPLRSLPARRRRRQAGRGASPGRAGRASARLPGGHGLALRLGRPRGRRLRLALLGPDRRAEPDRAGAGAVHRARAVARPRPGRRVRGPRRGRGGCRWPCSCSCRSAATSTSTACTTH